MVSGGGTRPCSFPSNIRGNDACYGKVRFLSVDGITLRKAILDNAEQGDAATADQALLRLEKLALEQNPPEDSLVYTDIDTYTAVLDAWIRHQKQVGEGPNQVNEMFQAADRAHTVVEKLQRRSATNEKDDGALRPTWHHYDAVLRAWLDVTRTMLQAETPLRGIPQRAQRILEQMEEQAESYPTSGVQPSIDHYNAVLEAWGNSPEHLRATRAEQLFSKLSDRPGVEPNNETYLILIRAWCRSKQDRAAFSATGHLMKMHRMKKQGVEGVELTMDDYHTILEAWTRAG